MGLRHSPQRGSFLRTPLRQSRHMLCWQAGSWGGVGAGGEKEARSTEWCLRIQLVASVPYEGHCNFALAAGEGQRVAS